jgi:hypothetical protein
LATALVTRKNYRPAGADFAVEQLGVVKHLNRQDFLFAVYFEVFWYSP